ncbi:MAG: hypothetical protein ACRETC_02430 [Gammaproteobacteria bacterium]
MDFETCVDVTWRLLKEKMPDPEYRRSLLEGTFERRNNPWLQLANAYEWLGTLVRWELIPETALMDMYAPRIFSAWKTIEPIRRHGRVGRGGRPRAERRVTKPCRC